MTTQEAGQIGADKRRYIERERIREGMGLPPDPRLYPTLVLTNADRVRG